MPAPSAGMTIQLDLILGRWTGALSAFASRSRNRRLLAAVNSHKSEGSGKGPVAPMPDDGDLGSREVHQTAISGERVLIRRPQTEDVAFTEIFG
jgi:hypothetical protein